MSVPEAFEAGLDPALERLMSEMDDALFAGRPVDELERQIAEQFGDSPSQIVSTLKALHSARAAHLSASSASAEQTQGTLDAITWPTSRPATTMFGRFEIVERLGSGGAGTVFRARDTQLARLVALKVARTEALFSGEAKQRFVREAQTLAALRHPHIIPIYEFGESGGLPYIVEELCEGPNLAVWLRQQAEARQTIPINTAVEWTLLLAEAVAHAHRCGIVHRDLKPSNVLLAPPTGTTRASFGELSPEKLTPRVTDFGIAKLFDSEEGVTASQAVLGTAAYMAPEQAEGRSREVGPPADVYSLGVILYELLTGRRPIEGRSDVDTLRRVLTDEPIPPTNVRRDIPRDLEAICLKCLEKDSRSRYLSAAELADDLRRFLAGEPVRARQLHAAARLMRALRRRKLSPAATLAGTILFALAICAGILILWRGRNGDLIVWQSSEAPQAKLTRHDYADDLHRASSLLHRGEVDVIARSASANEAREILAKYVPKPNGEDLRGFEWHYLWKIARPQEYAPKFTKLRAIPAHTSAAYSACFSPDGKQVATCSADGTARVWNVATGELRFTLAGHTNEVNCVAFSPDGKTLATASEDATLRLWDAATGAYRETLWKYNTEIVDLAFNPANGQLVSCARDGVVTVWDWAASRQLATLEAHPGRKIDNLVISPDGSLFATAGADSRLGLWQSTVPPHPIVEFKVYDPLSVGFSHDGRLLAVGHMNGARIFSARTGEYLSQVHYEGKYVRTVRFMPDDLTLLTAGDSSSLVDLITGETWDPFGVPGGLWCAALSPDGKLVATTDASGTLTFWDCSARLGFHRTELEVPAGTAAASLALSPDGGKVVVVADAPGGKDQAGRGETTVWDCSHSQPKRILQIASSQRGSQFRDVTFAPDGTTIALAESRTQKGRDSIRFIDAATGRQKLEIDADQVEGLFYTPGGSMLVSRERMSASEVRLQVRDAHTGANIRAIRLRSNPGLFAYSPSDNLFASTSEYHISPIDLYRLPDSQRIASIKGFGETIHALAFSKDARLLIGRGDGGYVAILSPDTGTVIRQFTVGGVSSVSGSALALSPDGHTLSLGSKEGLVLADFESGQPLCTLPFHGKVARVGSITFASDGQSVAASAANDQGRCEICLWQVQERASASPAAPLPGADAPKQLSAQPEPAPQPVAARKAYAEDLERVESLLRRADPDIEVRQQSTQQACQILDAYVPKSGAQDLRGFEWHYLWKITHTQESAATFSPVRLIAAHKGPVYEICFSPDGRSLAAASKDETASVWDVATGQPRFKLLGHTNEVNSIVYSPDGKTLATASEDGTVRLWNAETGAFQHTLWNDGAEISSLAFNPVNGQLACAAHDGKLTVWDCAARRQVAGKAYKEKINGVAFSPDGKLIAVASSDDNHVRLLEANHSFNTIAEIEVPDCNGVGFSHDGQLLAVTHFNGLRVYRVGTRELIAQVGLAGLHIRSVLFSADDSALLLAGDSPAVVDLTTGQIWDPFRAPDTLWFAAVSPNSKLVATGDVNGNVTLWDCAMRRNFHRAELPLPALSTAVSVAVSADGKKVAIAAEPTHVKGRAAKPEVAVWDMSASPPERLLQIVPKEDRGQGRAVAFTPEGSALAYSEQSEKGEVRIRVVDAATGALRFEIADGATELCYLYFARKGSMLVSEERYANGPTFRLHFREATSGKNLRWKSVAGPPAPRVAVPPNEDIFVAYGTNADSTINAFQFPSGAAIQPGKSGEPIRSMLFANDAKFVIVRNGGGNVSVLGREKEGVARRFTVPGVSEVAGSAMALSPDRRSLALGTVQGIVLADLESGQALCTLEFPSEMKDVKTLAFSSDGGTLVANTVGAGDRCGVYFWQIQPGAAEQKPAAKAAVTKAP
jgi:WD40 repeat protein/tRNA A-37 threonylcarbamoyl transferase component Bud32